MLLKLFFICLLALLTPASFAAELGQLTPEQLESLRRRQNPLVVDIRTQKEWNSTGTIPGSRKLQSFDEDGNFDKGKWLSGLKELQKSGKRPIVLVCRSGNRSRIVGRILAEQMDMENVYHLSDGIKKWLESGHKTENACQPTRTC